MIPTDVRSKPRLGFVGVGWIGRLRLQALAALNLCEVAAVADPAGERRDEATALAPAARACAGFDELLELDLDGVVLATPSALHAEQAIACLERGLPVFCQKPLALTAADSAAVVEAARQRDLLLGVDLSFRWIEGARRIRDLVAAGRLGDVYAARLCFHNAHGPDRRWFYDPALSGGGCVVDLGTHLVDLLLWTLGGPAVTGVSARCLSGGQPTWDPRRAVEDYAVAQLDLASGIVADLACSWNLPVGQEAEFEASFFGTRGSARLVNVAGSGFDFAAYRCDGTRRETLAEPPEEWGGRALADWAFRLLEGCGFDPEVTSVVAAAAVIDRIYEQVRSAGAAAGRRAEARVRPALAPLQSGAA